MHSPRVLDMTGRAELRTKMDTQQPMICSEGKEQSQKRCFPLAGAHRPPPHMCTPPPPLHVKLVPLIVRLVGLKLLITASRPPSSFQALFHWRRHGCLTRPRHSPNSLPSEEVPRRERRECTSLALPHPQPSPRLPSMPPLLSL